MTETSDMKLVAFIVGLYFVALAGAIINNEMDVEELIDRAQAEVDRDLLKRAVNGEQTKRFSRRRETRL